MNAVDRATDAEILEALDFDPAPACEVVMASGDRHGAAGVWIVRTYCCGFSVVMCEEHCEKWRVGSALFKFVTCGKCGHREDAFDLLVEFIPIGGA